MSVHTSAYPSNNASYTKEPNGIDFDDVKQENDVQMQNVEYVSEQLEADGSAIEAFSDVFARFQLPPESSTVRDNLSEFGSLAQVMCA